MSKKETYIVKRREYHQMTSTMTYDLNEEDIVDAFGSIDEFLEHFNEESDEFWEFMQEHDYDREDDLWTDRKGGYEVDWEIENEI